ncbi:MAG TPA: hypothetical protein VMG82_33335 [Candidatus Sulfotelmatobacter sp.]|nr:hypothetical protein [Candidatus Sulfotelmatobacter sp.]
MTNFGLFVSRSALVLFTAASLTALAGDLSRYRDFQLGSDLPTVAKLTGGSPSEAKLIHSRPALVQELEWRPQALGPSPKNESVEGVIFSFYNGTLFRIAVKYDRYATEGLTTEDFVEAISALYGRPAKLPAQVKPVKETYGDDEETVARWEDPEYRFDLLRVSYGPSYRLIGTLKSLEAPVQAANVEAKRLDDLEAPQRDAARAAAEQDAKAAGLEKARLVNKPKFRP